MVVPKRLLDGAEGSVTWRQPLDSGDALTVGLNGKDQTSSHRVIIEQDGAGSADAVLAGKVSAGESARIAEEIGKGRSRFDERATVLTIHVNGYRDLIHGGPP